MRGRNWTWRIIRLFCAVKSDNKQTFNYFEQQFGTLGFARIPCFVCIWRCDVTVCEQLWAWNSSTIGNRMLFLRVEGDPLALWYTNTSLNQHYACLRPIHAWEVHNIMPQSKDRPFFTSLLGKVSAVHNHKFLNFLQQLCMRHDLGKTSGRLTACLLQSSAQCSWYCSRHFPQVWLSESEQQQSLRLKVSTLHSHTSRTRTAPYKGSVYRLRVRI